MALYEFWTSRNNGVANTAAYVGQIGRLFYDNTDGILKISDGSTPGGIRITYPVANSTTVGGIKAGPGANVSVDGTLTIDTAGLPLSIGNLTIANTSISTNTSGWDLVLESKGAANVELVGNIRFYSTAQAHTGTPYFTASGDGQLTAYVTQTDPASGAFNLIGSTTGSTIAPGQSGTMLQITGQLSIPARIYHDGNNSYASIVGRRWNGNVTVPTQVLANEDILRINATAYHSGGMPGNAVAQISFTATENQTATNQGGRINFTVTPTGSNTSARLTVANISAAYGLGATKATIDGNVTAGNLTLNAVGRVSTAKVIYNDGGVRIVNGGVHANIDFATDSLVMLYHPNGTVNVNLSNYTAGSVVRVHVHLTATSRDINYGTAAASNSSDGATSFNGSGGGSTDISNTTMQLVYTCYDGTAANTYVAVTTI